MANNTWTDQLLELGELTWAGLRKFWLEDVWPVLMTLWIFFVFAAPLIVVVLILWYLDSTGWRASSGFYTIGINRLLA
jgi:hypothetical protein